MAIIENNCRNMFFVTPDTLDVSRISVEPSNSKDNIERYNIHYIYKDGSSPKNIMITVPRIPDAYIKCRGVKKDTYAAGETRIETNRYGAQFVLSGDNHYHTALYDSFCAIKQKIEEIMDKSEIGFPITDNGTSSTLYTQLIHANNGPMFSKAYTYDYDTSKGSQLDIISVSTDCVTRPAFMISMMKSSKGLKIRVQLSQMLVHSMIEEDFSLATME